jgi:hypothetical protein
MKGRGTRKLQNKVGIGSLSRRCLIVPELRSRPELPLVFAEVLHNEWADIHI